MFLPIKLCCLNQLWIIGSIIVMTNKQCMNLTQHIFIAQYKLLTEITFQFHWWTLAVGNRMFGICCIVLWPEHPTLVLSKTTWALESCIAPNYLHKSNHRNTGLFINWFPFNTHSFYNTIAASFTIQHSSVQCHSAFVSSTCKHGHK